MMICIGRVGLKAHFYFLAHITLKFNFMAIYFPAHIALNSIYGHLFSIYQIHALQSELLGVEYTATILGIFLQALRSVHQLYVYQQYQGFSSGPDRTEQNQKLNQVQRVDRRLDEILVIRSRPNQINIRLDQIRLNRMKIFYFSFI